MSLSLTGRRWRLNSPDLQKVERLRADHDLSELVATCLAPTLSCPATDWLSPSLSHFHDPYLMKGMDKAVDRIQRAIRDREQIRIVTDYDVDGTTSSLILQAACRLLDPKVAVDYHIPDRFVEGYGFSVQAAEKAGTDGVGLIITADIGVRDHSSVEAAAELGVDVLICDHHLPPGESVPSSAVSVLCPPQKDCDYPNPDLAACGVSLKLAEALLTASGRSPEMVERIIRSMMKIAAIGTVADVVSLSSLENRAIVSMGLDELRKPLKTQSLGLQALFDVCRIQDGWVTASEIGYQLAPRINAAGRLHLATDVIELFQAKNLQEARMLAERLDQFNKERREIEADLVQRSLACLPEPTPHFISVWGKESEGWHRGVVGIVASRLRDKTHRSAAVISICGENARGSVRVTPQVHAVRVLDSVKDLLLNYGGHAAAAGFDIPVSKLEEFSSRVDTYVKESCSSEQLVPELELSASCAPSDLSLGLAHSIYRLGPFGKDNPLPLLHVRNIRAENIRVLKEKHLKFSFGGTTALWWNAAQHLSTLQNGRFDIAGRIEINRWRQVNRLQFIVEDAMPVTDPAGLA